MRAVSLIKGILLNICIICSMVCIALKVLDWYNPYMDFAGHAAFIPYTLYISVFLYAILEAFSGRSRQEDKRKKHKVLPFTGNIAYRVLLDMK